MTLETILKPFSLFPRFAQLGNDEPPSSGMKRKMIHWVGHKEPVEQQQDPGGNQSAQSPKQNDSRGYRDLSSITLGEVNDAYKYFADQLLPSPYPAWLAPGYFCMIPLGRRRMAERPPEVFGRIKICYPSDGYVQNIQELELELPCKDRTPDIVHIRAEDIAPHKPVQSYCVRVKFLVTPEDMLDFAKQEQLFWQLGLSPEFSTAYIDILDISEHSHASLPWMYVISSRWFASVPVSIQPEIREKLTKLLHWNKQIFNYHPELQLPREVHSLNRELDFKPGFMSTFLIEPENAVQTAQIVSKTFDKVFYQPIK